MSNLRPTGLAQTARTINLFQSPHSPPFLPSALQGQAAGWRNRPGGHQTLSSAILPESPAAPSHWVTLHDSQFTSGNPGPLYGHRKTTLGVTTWHERVMAYNSLNLPE